jgi:hypothetical protein
MPHGPRSCQAFQPLLFKMHANRNMGTGWGNPLVTKRIQKDEESQEEISHTKKPERTHLAITYSLCYMFVYSLYNVNEKEQ